MFILVFAIIGAFSLNGIICPPVYAKENVKEISFTTESKMDSITLKWKRQKNVGFYKVYRMDITKKIEKSKFSPKRKNYKMLQTLQFSIRLPRGIRIKNDLGALTNRPVSVRSDQELLVLSQRLYLVNYISFLYIIQPVNI